MSATLADPYRDYAIDYAQHAHCKPEEQEGTLVYPTHPPHLQHPKQAESPFQQRSSHNSAYEQHHANATVLPAVTHQPSVHDLPQTVVLTPTQMLPPRQLPVHYTTPSSSFELSSVQQQQQQQHQQQQHHHQHQQHQQNRGKKRLHSETEDGSGGGSGGDGEAEHHAIRPQMSVLAPDATPVENPHSPEMLFSVHGADSSHHHQHQHHHHQHQMVAAAAAAAAGGHDFVGPPDSVALPQQHHHHRLPPHASLRDSQRHGMNVESSPMPTGPPSVVGQPGMPEPAPRPRGPKLKFTPEEDALLVELKENKNLTWKQIADFFPGRTSGTLQVRYCTKLKAKDVAWSDEMVQRLHRAMQEYENDRWRIIAGKVGNGFTPAACREKATQPE